MLSYDISLTRDALVGMIYVESDIIAYRNISAAHAAYVAAEKKGSPGKAYMPMSFSAIGADREAFTIKQKKSGFDITGDLVLFDHGPYLCLMAGTGITGAFTADDLFRFAHIVDQRMQQHT